MSQSKTVEKSAKATAKEPTMKQDMVELKKLRATITKTYLMIAVILSRVYANGAWKTEGFESFDDFALKEAGVTPKEAERLMLWNKKYISGFGVSIERLKDIGRKKLEVVDKVIVDKKSCDLWLDLCERQDIDIVKQRVSVEHGKQQATVTKESDPFDIFAVLLRKSTINDLTKIGHTIGAEFHGNKLSAYGKTQVVTKLVEDFCKTL